MLQHLVTLSITGSIIIILLTLIKKFSKQKYTSKLSYFLWIILAIRLLIPFNIPMQFNLPSINNIIDADTSYNVTDIDTSINHNSNDNTKTTISAINNTASYIQNSNNDSIINSESNNIDNITNTQKSLNVIGYTISNIKANEKSSFTIDIDIILCIWITGMIICFLYYTILQIFFLHSIYKTKAQINDANDVSMQNIADKLCNIICT